VHLGDRGGYTLTNPGVVPRRSMLIVAPLLICMFAGVGCGKMKVAENAESHGYKMVRALKFAGKIKSFAAVQPPSGEETEYEVNEAEAEIFFKGNHLEIVSKSESLTEAIEHQASVEGYSVEHK
jgi:hypothetical protein